MASEPDDIDALFEAAMQQYCPEPRTGIERRVLIGVRRKKRRRQLWVLAFAVPVVVLLAVLYLPRRRHNDLAAMANLAEPKPIIVLPKIVAVPRRIRPHRARTFPPFPTPSPLTEEEKALQALVFAQPEEAQKLLFREGDKPIEIEALQIPPLQSGGGR